MAARHKAKIETSDGPRTCFEARKQRQGKKDLIARFGGIPLKHDSRAVIADPAPTPVRHPRKELITRLLKRERELCEQSARWPPTMLPSSLTSAVISSCLPDQVVTCPLSNLALLGEPQGIGKFVATIATSLRKSASAFDRRFGHSDTMRNAHEVI